MKVLVISILLLIILSSKVLAGGGSFYQPYDIKKFSESVFEPNNKENIHQDFYQNPKPIPNLIMNNLFWSFIGAVIGSLFALVAQKYQDPKLKIIAEESANDDHVYPVGHINAGQRWKFFRVHVRNCAPNKYLSWIIKRSTAQQVNAKITISELNKSFKGRWADTLELVNASPFEIIRIINYPDPITIIAGEQTPLDIFTKCGSDQEAYGWNNEAYLHNWRTPHYMMTPNDYHITVQVVALNGTQIKTELIAHIGNTIDETYLRNIS